MDRPIREYSIAPKGRQCRAYNYPGKSDCYHYAVFYQSSNHVNSLHSLSTLSSRPYNSSKNAYVSLDAGCSSASLLAGNLVLPGALWAV